MEDGIVKMPESREKLVRHTAHREAGPGFFPGKRPDELDQRSKIKPCMSKYKLLYTVKLRMAH